MIQVCRLTVHTLIHCTCDVHAFIVMPRPLSVSQERIIIVLYYSVKSEVSAVRKLESPLVGSFFDPCMELCPL